MEDRSPHPSPLPALGMEQCERGEGGLRWVADWVACYGPLAARPVSLISDPLMDSNTPLEQLTAFRVETLRVCPADRNHHTRRSAVPLASRPSDCQI
jgi:hypothetical protein